MKNGYNETMKTKYFVVSDIHSYYDELIAALKKHNFDAEKDFLVVAGDLFDRGPKPVETFEFLKGLKNKILIRGNHEDLLVFLAKRGYPLLADEYNGTASTLGAFMRNGMEKEVLDFIGSIKLKSVEIGNYIICHSTPKDNWANPFLQERDKTGKTIVFGHWYVDDAKNYCDGEIRDGIFYSSDGKLIGIDSGWSKRNVFVIEE